MKKDVNKKGINLHKIFYSNNKKTCKWPQKSFLNKNKM